MCTTPTTLTGRRPWPGVSLRAAAGEVLGLLGPNGAGKTTLMALVAGLLPLQRGEILIEGPRDGPPPAATIRRRWPWPRRATPSIPCSACARTWPALPQPVA